MPILFEDNHFVALDKMTHMAVTHSQRFPDRPSLDPLIRHAISSNAGWVTKRGVQYMRYACRIDFETSGVVLFCKSSEARQGIGDLMGSNRVERQFHCLVHGRPEQSSFEIGAKVGWLRGQPELMRAGNRGKHALTRFEVVEQFNGFTLLRCQLETDRKHQIRTHLQYANIPIVGDACYGGQMLLLSRIKPHYRPRRDGTEKPLIDRTALHFNRLVFEHPITRGNVIIQSPMARDMEVAMKYLRKYCPYRGQVGSE
ncbi:MAG: RluA family pseudouridine synthase [Verrucomicrobiota bacterium]|nr:RluA family pseudouridine synthase [Verrucomicrobiota bacterium]